MTFWTNSGFEPKREFRFKVEIAGIPAFYVKSVTKPKFSIGQGEHKFLNRTFYFPGHVTWEPVTATFIDDAQGTVMASLGQVMALSNYGDIAGQDKQDIFGPDGAKFKTIQKQALTQASKDLTGQRPAASDLSVKEAGAQEIVIRQLDSTGDEGNVVEQITLYNGWISSITPSDLSYESEDLSSYEIELRYDWADILKPQ